MCRLIYAVWNCVTYPGRMVLRVMNPCWWLRRFNVAMTPIYDTLKAEFYGWATEQIKKRFRK